MRLLVLFICLLLPASVQAACKGRDLRPDMPPQMREELEQVLAETPFPEGNHWIANKGDTVLHLIGTMHFNDPRMNAVVSRLAPTLGQADAFYFEVTQEKMNEFERNLASDYSPVLITSGPTLIDLMSDEDWDALSKTLLDRGIPGWMAAKMRPWYLGLVLGVPPCMSLTAKADRGLDARLAELADAHDIPQYSLERIEDIIAIFDSDPIEVQVQSLAKFAVALAPNDDHMATMTNGYFEERHAELMQLARVQGREASGLPLDEFRAEWDKFEQQLLVQRNNNWMQHILAIRDQTAVIAVGAGHLSDTYGLLNQLHEAGYTLTRAPF